MWPHDFTFTSFARYIIYITKHIHVLPANNAAEQRLKMAESYTPRRPRERTSKDM